jgi:hypothetical protein
MAAEDKVTPFPTLERLAIRAAQAMVEYRAGEAEQSKGRQRSINAVIAYGRALLEGREGRSNIAFSQWVSENKLDVGKPWKHREERHCAMKIAEAVVSNTTNNIFDACPNTTPTNIMSWYRAKTQPKSDGGSQRKHKKNNLPAADAAAKLVLDKNLSHQKAGEETGAGSELLVRVAVAREEGRREARGIIEEELAAAGVNLTAKSKLKIDDAIRIQTTRLNKQFEQRVNDEVRKRIDTADDFTRQENKRLRQEVHSLNTHLSDQAVFTETQFKQMLMLCHPDSSASPQTKAELLQVLIKNKKRLVKQ